MYNEYTLASEINNRTPTLYRDAVKIPEWRESIRREYKNLIDNGTFEIIYRKDMPRGAGFVDTKFVFKTKMKDGVPDSLKTRITARGFSTRAYRDYDPSQLFAPVATFDQIRLMIAHAARNHYHIHHWAPRGASPPCCRGRCPWWT